MAQIETGRFRFTVKRCPLCNHAPKALRERVYGDALITHRGAGFYEYAGETDIDWDSQESALSDNGKFQLVCGYHHCGHMWETDIEGATL